MFLSPQTSQLDIDGSLIVDLAEEGGPRMRLEPIATGFRWFEWRHGDWQPREIDPGFRLVTPAHRTRRDLPVLRFLAGLPSFDVDALERVQYLQMPLLQLYARSAAARDLLRSNLALLWLVASRATVDGTRRSELLDALRQPQRAVLSVVLDEPTQAAQVTFLKKLVLDSADRRVFDHAERLVTVHDFVLGLRHWRRIPGELLPLLAEAPGLAVFNLLRQEISDATDDYDIRRILTQRTRLVRDTIRLLRLLRSGRGGERALWRLSAWTQVQALHDDLLKALRKVGPRSLLASNVDPFRPFPVAPLMASSIFVPIRNAIELAEEGELMHHCVLTRAPEVMAGRSAIYRVQLPGERGTLEVSIGPNGEPLSIEDFRLTCNAAPSRAAWAIANEWLYEGRRRWNATHVTGLCYGATQTA